MSFLDPRVEAAFIAGAISIIVALISFLANRSKLRAELKTLKLQQKHDVIEKLFELRFESYPEVFEITKNIGKRSNFSNEDIINIVNQAKEKLSLWHSKKSGLLLSKESLKTYYELRDTLKKNPAHEEGYTDEQLKKIWNARNSFRGSLRDDVRLLH